MRFPTSDKTPAFRSAFFIPLKENSATSFSLTCENYVIG